MLFNSEHIKHRSNDMLIYLRYSLKSTEYLAKRYSKYIIVHLRTIYT